MATNPPLRAATYGPVADPPLLRAATYSRQSRAWTKSIEDQADLNRATVHTEGWQLVAEYSDGTSASRFSRKQRDDWQRVLNGIRTNEFDVLVLWEPSRGDRQPETWFAMLAQCRKQNIRIHIVSHNRTYDMATNPRDWRTLAEEGVDSAYESEKIAQRVTRGQASSAAQGKPSHGRPPFGYKRVHDVTSGKLIGQEPNEDQVPIVQGIIRRVADGHPISVITNDLNARDIKSASGGRWYRQRVRDVATNPAYIGQRVYNAGRYDGIWEPIVDPATFWAAQRVLSDPARTTTRPGRQKHLLTYLATCQPCEEDRLLAGEQPSPLTAVRGRYRCLHNGCVTLLQDPADRFVRRVFIRWLARPDRYSALRQAGEEADQEILAARAESERLRGDLDKWRLSAARGQTSPESLASIETELTGLIRAADRRATTTGAPVSLRQIMSLDGDATQRWDNAPLPVRRDLIRTWSTVRILPATLPGSPTFEPRRIQITWRRGNR